MKRNDCDDFPDTVILGNSAWYPLSKGAINADINIYLDKQTIRPESRINMLYKFFWVFEILIVLIQELLNICYCNTSITNYA